MSYRVCTNCGQKALAIATRCPRCNSAFAEQTPPEVPAPPPRRFPIVPVVAGLAVVIVAGLAIRQLTVRGRALEPPSVVASEAAQAPPPAVAADSAAAPPTLITDTAAQVVLTKTAEPSAPPPTARQSEPKSPSRSTSTSAAAGEFRYASTWVNVRSDRKSSAPVVRILLPGEVVRVDSLKVGWYRVVSDGQAAGYVDRRLLGTTRGPAVP